jgi:hypothetical protein
MWSRMRISRPAHEPPVWTTYATLRSLTWVLTRDFSSQPMRPRDPACGLSIARPNGPRGRRLGRRKDKLRNEANCCGATPVNLVGVGFMSWFPRHGEPVHPAVKSAGKEEACAFAESQPALLEGHCRHMGDEASSGPNKVACSAGPAMPVPITRGVSGMIAAIAPLPSGAWELRMSPRFRKTNSAAAMQHPINLMKRGGHQRPCFRPPREPAGLHESSPIWGGLLTERLQPAGRLSD